MELVESVLIEDPAKSGRMVKIFLTAEEAVFVMQTGLMTLFSAGAISLADEKDGVKVNDLLTKTEGNA